MKRQPSRTPHSPQPAAKPTTTGYYHHGQKTAIEEAMKRTMSLQEAQKAGARRGAYGQSPAAKQGGQNAAWGMPTTPNRNAINPFLTGTATATTRAPRRGAAAAGASMLSHQPQERRGSQGGMIPGQQLSSSNNKFIPIPVLPIPVPTPLTGVTTAAAPVASVEVAPKFPARPAMAEKSTSESLAAGLAAGHAGRLGRSKSAGTSKRQRSRIYDDPAIIAGYKSVPLMHLNRLPRGGICLETRAIGRLQFGIPPETIKDSMRLGFDVPQAYIVPVERFSQEMGPALGINLAEFEFPAYFNYFVRGKQCALVVDSMDAEYNIRRVFGETLLGPSQFRDHDAPKYNEDEDFDPTFPKEKRPNFYKEFYHFRTAEKSTNYEELTIDTLIEFCHFKGSQHGPRKGIPTTHDKLGVPPVSPEFIVDDDEAEANDGDGTRAERRHTIVVQDSFGDSFNESLNTLNTMLSEDEESKKSEGPTGFRRSLSDPDMQRRTSMDVSVSTVASRHSNRRGSLASVGDRRGSMASIGEYPTSRRGSTATSGSSEFQRRGSLGDSPRRPFHRGSVDTGGSSMSYGSRGQSGSGMSWASLVSDDEEEDDPNRNTWMYSQAKWLGDVATLYPKTATDEQKASNKCPRVEIFKMTGGTEYIVHDVDENNTIVGKARFSGTVRVPDEIAVEGFLTGHDDDEDFANEQDAKQINGHSVARDFITPTFHPPSFGVTVLGNSHGFDKNGSVSGYVLWINGRGIMIDPPPYSSATLEREGIRPQMIMAIIITHCHADHDAGTFQKVMTGSRVAIITTPTIYKSFIRKYAALSGLSPALLRHSHRHRPAIIGQPLLFQGAAFHFTYTLHTIPCIAFKVVWRGRSIVFTGDHLNAPLTIDNLESMGVMTKERADDLRHLPVQDCDVLLHEAGAPPIHTPLAELQKLPEEVKNRLFVVHTSALPPGSGLRVAPTGTAGTIRLDEPVSVARPLAVETSVAKTPDQSESTELKGAETSGGAEPSPPAVFLRPTSVSDAWFVLNLLSNVPFLSSLSYAYTMEVLEIAQVEMFRVDETVVSADRRPDVLCVIWEGTCIERETSDSGTVGMHPVLEETPGFNDSDSESMILMAPGGVLQPQKAKPTVWHAGDWTGPVALQPDAERSAESSSGEALRDIVALSQEGVKVIMLNMKDLFRILQSGSKLFRKYLTLKEKQAAEEAASKAEMVLNEAELRHNGQINHAVSRIDQPVDEQMPQHWNSYDSVLQVLKLNSALGRLTALQMRHLESLAEGPRFFEAGSNLWQVGETVDYAFLLVAGTALFAQKSTEQLWFQSRRGSTGMMALPVQVVRSRPRSESMPGEQVEEDKMLVNFAPNSEYARLEIILQLKVEEIELDTFDHTRELMPKEARTRTARDRFANKVLARLYARRAYTSGLVFSRGHLLSDTSRMVSGNLAHIHHSGGQENMGSIGHGLAGDHHCHTSNMLAGPDGCVVMVFPRSTLVQFLDGNPGVLLSLLGTQVVV